MIMMMDDEDAGWDLESGIWNLGWWDATPTMLNHTEQAPSR